MSVLLKNNPWRQVYGHVADRHNHHVRYRGTGQQTFPGTTHPSPYLEGDPYGEILCAQNIKGEGAEWTETWAIHNIEAIQAMEARGFNLVYVPEEVTSREQVVERVQRRSRASSAAGSGALVADFSFDYLLPPNTVQGYPEELYPEPPGAVRRSFHGYTVQNGLRVESATLYRVRDPNYQWTIDHWMLYPTWVPPDGSAVGELRPRLTSYVSLRTFLTAMTVKRGVEEGWRYVGVKYTWTPA